MEKKLFSCYTYYVKIEEKGFQNETFRFDEVQPDYDTVS